MAAGKGKRFIDCNTEPRLACLHFVFACNVSAILKLQFAQISLGGTPLKTTNRPRQDLRVVVVTAVYVPP